MQADAAACLPVERLASAYALDGRVSLRSTPRSATAWRFVGVPDTVPEWALRGSLDASPPNSMAEMVDPLWPPDAGPSSTHRQDAILSGHRVAVVTNLPTHYRAPLFSGLAGRLTGAGATLRVLFLGARARGRPWLIDRENLEFDHEFLKSVSLPVRRRRAPFLPANLRGRLRSFDPTIVVVAGFSPASAVEAALYANRRHVPFGIWSGETPSLAAGRRPRAIRQAQRRWLVRRADFGIAYGSLADCYLRSIAPELPVVIGRNTSVSEVKARLEPDASRATLELVSVADLSVPGKGIDVVVRALEMLGDLSCRLTVIGGGSETGQWDEARRRDSRIRFLGPQSHEKVLAAYQSSDVFLFPTRADPFGLALVEAMAAGLAVIVSRAAGATADLGVPGRNCLLADADPRSWADCIRRLAGDERLRRSLAVAARETIARRWTTGHAVESMVAGLRLGAMASGRSAR